MRLSVVPAADDPVICGQRSPILTAFICVNEPHADDHHAYVREDRYHHERHQERRAER